jgi:hypothetical protein
MWQAGGDGGVLQFNRLGGILTAAPSCTAPESNRLHCMVRGSDNAAWVQRWDGTRWSGWINQGGGLASAPSCASWGPGRADCFVLGGGFDLYHQWQLMSGQAGGWGGLGGIVRGNPSCVTSGDNRLTCYVRGTDDALWQRGWDGSNWTPWLQIPGTAGRLAAAPSCSAARDGKLAQCTVVVADGSLLSISARAESLAPGAGLQVQTLVRTGAALEAPGCLLREVQGARQLDCVYRRSSDRSIIHSMLQL